MIGTILTGFAVLGAWAAATWIIGYVFSILLNTPLILTRGFKAAINDVYDDMRICGNLYPFYIGVVVDMFIVIAYFLGAYVI